MSENESILPEQDKDDGITERCFYEPPTLMEDEVFERAVYAACKSDWFPPESCNPVGINS